MRTHGGIRRRQRGTPRPRRTCSAAAISDLKITTLADIEAERVEWLWHGRLPRGKLVVFDGDPELGKSTLAVTFAAVVTTEYETEDGMYGGLWPDGTRCEYSGDVIILSAEDGLADTVRPRLDAAGANAAKVHAIEAAIIIDEDGKEAERHITLADVDRLDRAIRHYHASAGTTMCRRRRCWCSMAVNTPRLRSGMRRLTAFMRLVSGGGWSGGCQKMLCLIGGRSGTAVRGISR
jgi:hypothetical protein